MKKKLGLCFSAAILLLAAAAASPAQTTAPPPPAPSRPVFVMGGRGGPGMGDATFEFAGIVGDFGGKTVKGAPFSADVTRESIQLLADGNRIDHKETGTIARDAEGRTRREMTLPAIGPWAAAGQVPQLVFIRDPVAGMNYILDQNKKTAVETRLRVGRPRWRQLAGGKMAQAMSKEITTQPLGRKTMDGVKVEGTRITRTIPAGQIGNQDPIVITTERWYATDLQTTVLLTRKDPRFGTTTYRLTNIHREDPPQALFTVPHDYTLRKGLPFRSGTRAPAPPDH